MAQVLDDGTVVPSHLSTSSSSARVDRGWTNMFNNAALRVGYLTAVHYKKESKSITYDAIVPQVDGNGAEALVPYFNCKVVSSFGSCTDWEKKTFRCPTSYKGKYDEAFLKSTTKVLILCPNGRVSNPMIVGADSNIGEAADSVDDGHNWQWVFNGIHWTIDKEGQLSIVFNGPNVDAENRTLAPDPKVAGTKLQFQKDGSILLDDADGESIKIDKKNKRISLISKDETHVTKGGGWTLECDKDVSIHAKGNAILNADGKTYIGSPGAAEPLVLGAKLLAALQELVQIFVSSPAAAVLGMAPLPMFPALKAQLAAWGAKYATPSSPVVSKKKFTE